ncbi:MAG: hypothetical protein ABJ388_17180 [Alphaproteobacteria bacterium]|uniref:hypothetical protein n=1 Tax=Nisaea sp. TaxID=2024842 RepID=UPI0032670678
MEHLTFFGKIVPERALLDITAPTTISYEDAYTGKTDVSLHIYVNQIVIDFKFSNKDFKLIDVKNTAERICRIVSDFSGYLYGIGYGVEIASAINHNTGEVRVFGIQLDVTHDSTEVRATRFNELLRATALSPFVAPALSDLTAAIRVPEDTGVYCYRAFETILHDFDQCKPEGTGVLEHMGVALNLGSAQRLKKFLGRHAGDRRHGKPVEISWAARKAVMKRAWLLMDRYLEYLIRNREHLPEIEFPIPTFDD